MPKPERLRRLILERGLLDEATLTDLGDDPARWAQHLLSEGILSGTALACLLAETPMQATPVATRGPMRRLAGYEIEREQARGGMGVVYLARDPRLDRRVAIKILFGEPTDQTLARFEREARLAAGLSHPGIIAVHEVGTAVPEGESLPVHFIVMDFVEGQTLAAAMQGLPLQQKMELFSQIVDAMAHAHEAGVVHRDLKPSNILVGKDGRPVVTDFGLARDTQTSDDLTQSGAVLGTTPYMAPEQVVGRSKHSDARTDVWALGVILYQLLTRALPFPGQSAAEIYEGILTRSPRRPHELDPQLPPELEAICLKALTKEPGSRHPDARSLGRDLERWRKGQPLIAPGRARLGVAAACVLLGLLVWGVLRHRAREQTEAPASGQRTQAAAAQQQAWVKERTQAVREVARLTAELRAGHYVPAFDVLAHRRELGASLKALRRLAALPQHANEASVWIELGLGWFWNGSIDRAERCLLRAEALAPTDNLVNLYLGRIQLHRASLLVIVYDEPGANAIRAAWDSVTRRALRYMTRVESDWTGAREIDRVLVDAYRQVLSAKPEQLHKICDAAMKRFEGQLGREEFLMLRGFYSTDGPKMKAMTQVLKIRPHYPLALYWRAWTRSRGGNHRGAIDDCTAALRLRPGFKEAVFTRALARQRGGDLRGARDDYRRCVEQHPDFALAWYNCGQLGAMLGDYPAAIADLTAALRLDPKRAERRMARAAAYRRSGDRVRALADIRQTLLIDPQNAAAYFERGLMKKLAGDVDGAIADYTRSLERRPDDVITLNNRGVAYRAKGRIDLALADYTRVLKLAPKDAGAYYNRGNLERRRKRPDAAVADYSAALAIRPRYVNAMINRGLAYLDLDKQELARADWTKALELSPGNAVALTGMGRIFLLEGKPRQAIDCFSRALQRAPKSADAYGQRAIARMQLRDLKGGASDAKMLTVLQPGAWRSWFLYGSILLLMKRNREAKPVLERAKRLAPAAWKPRVEQYLKKLR